MDPFNNMESWRKNMDRFFGEDFWEGFEGVLKPSIPHINLYQTDNEILCYANIPGLENLNKIDVFVDYTVLEIKGVIQLDTPEHQMIQEEILQGAFERKIDLPFPVRNDKINATYQNGLLMIQLHRLIHREGNKNRVKIQHLDE